MREGAVPLRLPDGSSWSISPYPSVRRHRSVGQTVPFDRYSVSSLSSELVKDVAHSQQLTTLSFPPLASSWPSDLHDSPHTYSISSDPFLVFL